MRTVVVTGAAGALGSRVLESLSRRSDVARVIAVDIAEQPVAAPVEAHRIDLAAPPAGPDPLAALLSGAGAVIHLAWAAAAGRPVDEENRAALRRVLAALDPGAALVYVSSATVYGAWPDNPVPLSEDVPVRPNPGFGFAWEKAEAERLLTEWAGMHPQAAVCVLRPCAVVGSTERPLYRALAGVRSPKSDGGSRPVQFLHIDDLASAVITAWDKRLAGIFNVAPDQGIGEDTARALAGGLGRVALPAPVARVLADWAWRLVRAGAPRESEPYRLYPWTVAADRLRSAGWRPVYTSEEALVATDDRLHWDDLPPGRRQEVTMIAGGAAAIAGVAGISAAALAVRRRVRGRHLGAGGPRPGWRVSARPYARSRR